MRNFLLNKKKIPSDIPKWSFSRFWDRTWDPFRESTISFSQNWTYSYSFLGWNLPEITTSLESLDNYFGITVKSRKNDEKFGNVDFCLWSRNNVGIIATLWWSPVTVTAKNNMINFFFHKTKFRSTSENSRFPILRPNLKPLSGIENFFFSQFNLLVQFFGVKFTGNWHVVGIIT